MGLTYFLSPLHAQDSTVTIPSDAARFFLEQNEKVRIHEVKDLIQDSLIVNLTTQIKVKDQIIASLQGDTLIYKAREEALKDNSKWLEVDLKATKKELRKSQFRGTVLLGAGAGALVGSVFPGAGTLIGTAVGAGVGAVVGLTRRY